MRTRDWRRFKRFSKMMRRLKKDWNQHYEDLTCPCRVDPKVRSMFADTPKRCSCSSCGNRRRNGKGVARLLMCERRAPQVVDRDSFGRDRKYSRPEPVRVWRIQCVCGFFLRLSAERPDWMRRDRCESCARVRALRIG